MQNPPAPAQPVGNLPHDWGETATPEETDLKSRTPTKVNGVSITDVGNIAVGFLSKIIQQQQEAARQAPTQEEAEAAKQRAAMAKMVVNIAEKAVANGISAAASAAAAAATEAKPTLQQAGKDLTEAKKQATLAVVNKAKNTMLDLATSTQTRENEQSAIVPSSSSSVRGVVGKITGLVSGLAQSARDYATAAASSSGAQTSASVKAMQKALAEADLAEKQANYLQSAAQHFFIGETPFIRVVPPTPAAIMDRTHDPFNATMSRPQGSLASIKRAQALREIEETAPASEAHDASKQHRTLYGFFGMTPSIIPHERPAPRPMNKPRGTPPPAAASAPQSLSSEGPFHDQRHPLRRAEPELEQPAQLRPRKSRWDKTPTEEQHLAHLIEQDSRSPEVILQNPQLLRTLHSEAKRRANAGYPLVRGSGRGRIHVPDPVLPHNDVANDPYLIKSHHNNIIE
jgi:hypothetical protein